MSPMQIATLRNDMQGQVLEPGDRGYERARPLWNAMIDKRPALIVQCASTTDIVAALGFARSHGLEVAVRGGGHNVAGSGLCEGGAVLDLSPMRAVSVDAERRTARAGGGARWGDYDAATQRHGLASTGGAVSTTGIAGLTLGGGFGWLSRSYGLACDELIGAEVVTAAGEVITASAAENSELLWGLRGGGGNFGIVTSFEYRLHPVGELLAGLLLYPRAAAGEVFDLWAELTARAPDALGSMAALLATPDADPVAGVYAVWHGSPEEGARLLEPLRSHRSILLDDVGPKAYCAVQQAFDAAQPPGRRNYWKSHFLTEIDPRLVDALIAGAATVPSATYLIAIEHLLGGAVARVASEETAFGARDAEHNLLISSAWDAADEDQANVGWARDLFAATRPFSTGAAYVNYLNAEEPERIGEAYAPEHYRRLVALKDRFDPDNVFRHNQNVAPSARAAG
ncbi:MAG TPA: FAD-binding oxidoreductase [Thermoanaerobaculia bacterium]|nr:FAD-binding oxidoreductase [Thermoanaerobaculia bacterium]